MVLIGQLRVSPSPVDPKSEIGRRRRLRLSARFPLCRRCHCCCCRCTPRALVFAPAARLSIHTPTATSTHSSPSVQSAASPGVRIPVIPAFRLYDPDSTGVYGVAFSQDGSTLAAGDLNGSAYLWDVAKVKVAGTFPDSNGEGIFGVALSPDGTMLAASTVNVHGYTKGSIVLWNTSSGKLIDTLNAPNGRAFGPLRPRSARTVALWPPLTPTAASTCGTPQPANPPARS